VAVSVLFRDLRELPSNAKQNRIKVATIQPCNVAADLLALSSDEESLKLCRQQSGASVLNPEDVAASVVRSLGQLDHVSVSVILVDPCGEPV
jgi:NADP-dependent 3-hydroxy acid dehydrogenase YdfG